MGGETKVAMNITTHYLKIHPNYFGAVCSGRKKFEIRYNDRDFQTYDTLVLQEYDPETNSYTGQEITKTITYILHGPTIGVESGYCILSID